MKKEFNQPFLDAFKFASEGYFGEEILSEKIVRDNNFLLKTKVVIAIGIRRDLKGVVLFGFEEEDAKKYAEKAMKSYGITESDYESETYKSILKEFGNTVVGRAMELYGKLGYSCEITPPTYIDDLSVIEAFGQEESFRFELTSETGKIIGKLRINE